MNKKKVIIGIVILMVVAIIAIIVFKKVNNKNESGNEENTVVTNQMSQIEEVDNYKGKLSDGSYINTNAKFNEPSNLGDLFIDNIRLTLKNGVTSFRAMVTNNGENMADFKNVTLTLLDENGKELVKAKGIIPQMEAGKSQELAISVTSNYLNACGYKITEE